MTRFPWGPRGSGVGEEGLPSAPGTRARGSPEGEVSRPRDFPKGNTEERAPGLCPPCPLRASSLISLLPAATPPTPPSFHYGICGSSLTFRENPKFLSPELAGSTPQHPLHPVSVPDPGGTGSRWLHRRAIHLAAVPGTCVSATGTLCRPWRLPASHSVFQLRCHLL